MIRKLDRYVLREMILPMLIGTVAVTLMFQLNLIIDVYKRFGADVLTPLAILNLIYYKTPYFLGQTLPIGVALAASLTVARFSRESELTAIRSSGVSIARFIFPVFVFGVVIGVVNWCVSEFVQPKFELRASDLYNQYNLAIKHRYKPDVVIRLKQYLASFSQVSTNEKGVLFNDPVFVERKSPSTMTIISGFRGRYEAGTWLVENALERVMEGEKLLSIRSIPQFTIKENVQIADLFSDPNVTEQTMQMLKSAIGDAKKQARDATILEIAYYARSAVPAACAVFALTGAVFAIWSSRSGPFMGLLISLLIVMLYFNAYVISTQIIGPSRALPPLFAAWAPNILFFLAGVFALRRIE